MDAWMLLLTVFVLGMGIGWATCALTTEKKVGGRSSHG